MTRWIAVLLGLWAAACSTQRQASPERQAEVAARGARVMPFDLAKTRHVFESLPEGGLQTVSAKDPGDTTQVRLIREHLAAEATKFSRGDFEDPMAIHGHEMPGVPELRRGFSGIRVEYTPEATGARIRYLSKDPALVAALHRWFEAQRADHGKR